MSVIMKYGSGGSGGAVGASYALLWQNASPGSSFAAQTVTVDLNGFSEVMVISNFSTGTQNLNPPVIAPIIDGSKLALNCASGSYNRVGARVGTIDLSAPGIAFAGANYNGSADNTYCIPLYIYGIRKGSTGGGGSGGGGGAVTSVNGRTGAVVLNASDVGAVPSGQGVPSGGTTGQVLAKHSNADHDLEWVNAGGGSTEIYWATYGSTTAAEIYAELSAGKLVLCEYNYNVYVLSEYDDQNDYAGFFCGGNGYRNWLTVYNSTWARTSSIWPVVATATPQDLGTAAVGTSTKYAREDHVHNKPTPAGIGAIAAPASPTAGDFLVWDGSAWTAMSMSAWQGGNY